MNTCKAEGCKLVAKLKGYCNTHYEQMRTRGYTTDFISGKNKVVIYSTYVELILTNTKNIEVARTKISLADKDKVTKCRWRKIGNGYVMNNTYGYLHRFILDASDKEYVDHINHDVLDNRVENLRICTNQENIANQKVMCKNTSGFKGVSLDSQGKSWRARLTYNGKECHLGAYPLTTEGKLLAALAYNKKALELYGEFAYLNVLPKEYTNECS